MPACPASFPRMHLMLLQCDLLWIDSGQLCIAYVSFDLLLTCLTMQCMRCVFSPQAVRALAFVPHGFVLCDPVIAEPL